MTDKKLLHLLDQNPEEGMGLLMEEYMGLLWSAAADSSFRLDFNF
mgnify:CR=1 FL=1